MDGWIRYPRPPESNSPRRQLPIYHHNATARAQSKSHDDGQWRVRIENQALSPAELYDDEDRYQKWVAPFLHSLSPLYPFHLSTLTNDK
jgi:hypothetical protein